MDEVWIPIVGIVCVFGLPVAGWITVRLLAHRERMAMLQAGMIPPPQRGFRGKWAAPPPPPQMQTMPYGYEDQSSPEGQLRRGIVTAAVGVALVIGLSFIGYHGGDGPLDPPRWRPGPWLLGGLIPMFVGVAQIGIGVLSGARFPLLDGRPPASGVDAAQAPFRPSTAPGQPGPRFEELVRPMPPSDPRSQK